MARGDRRERIVHDENDRYNLIQTLGEACGKTGWLMSQRLGRKRKLERATVR